MVCHIDEIKYNARLKQYVPVYAERDTLPCYVPAISVNRPLLKNNLSFTIFLVFFTSIVQVHMMYSVMRLHAIIWINKIYDFR